MISCGYQPGIRNMTTFLRSRCKESNPAAEGQDGYFRFRKVEGCSFNWKNYFPSSRPRITCVNMLKGVGVIEQDRPFSAFRYGR
jgi:hypothetical protein